VYKHRAGDLNDRSNNVQGGATGVSFFNICSFPSLYLSDGSLGSIAETAYKTREQCNQDFNAFKRIDEILTQNKSRLGSSCRAKMSADCQIGSDL
jgi:hypothetical protein